MLYYGLELYRYHSCRLLKYPIPIMRLIIYKSVHSKCSFPKQRSAIANQEHILLLTLTIMEMVGSELSGCQIGLRFIFSCFRLISLFRNACFANFTICF